MKKLFLTIGIVLTGLVFTYGQKMILEGIVVDKETNTPLPYAQVALKDLKKGTITDLDGKFRLVVSDSSKKDTIKVSMIGYSSHTIQVNDFFNKSNKTIGLTFKITTLDAIVISDPNIKKQSGFARSLVENAIDNIHKNYPTRMYLLQGYFRTAYKENDQYTNLIETTFDLYDAGYQSNYKDIGNLIIDFKEVRKSNDYRQFKYKDDGEYIDLLIRSCDDIRNQSRIMNKKLHKHYSFAMDGATELDGKKIYIVKAQPNELAFNRHVNSYSENYTPFVRLYIRDGDYAVTKIESDYSHLVDKWSSFGGVTDTTYSKNKAYYTTYEYAEFDEKWYLYYKSFNREWEVYDNRSNKKITDYLVEEETIFDERSARVVLPEHIKNNILKYNFMSPNKLHNKQFEYNAAYWRNSNKNVKTRLFRDVKMHLEKHAPLEQQFEENGI